MDLGDFFGLLVFLAFILLPALGRRAQRQARRPEQRTEPAPQAPRPVAFPAWPPAEPPRPRPEMRRTVEPAPRPALSPMDTEDWTTEGGDQTPEQIASHAEALGSSIAQETQDLDDDRRRMAERTSRLGSLRVGGQSQLGPGLRTELGIQPAVAEDEGAERPAPGFFNSREELRRAVVMAEILGRRGGRRRPLQRR